MNDSTADKAIILKAHKAEKPRVQLPSVKERPAFRERIERALPAFVHWLTLWEIPAELGNGRYGVKPYQNPELSEKLDKMSDKARVIEMIDLLLFDHLGQHGPWQGSATELELLLRECAKECGEARELEKVCWNRQALGNGLGDLARNNPDRVEKRSRQGEKGDRGWIIYPPADKEPGKESDNITLLRQYLSESYPGSTDFAISTFNLLRDGQDPTVPWAVKNIMKQTKEFNNCMRRIAAKPGSGVIEDDKGGWVLTFPAKNS